MVQHLERLLDLDRVLPDMRRPAAQAKADVDDETGPPGDDGKSIMGQAGQTLDRTVDDVAQVRAYDRWRADGLVILAG